MTIHILAPEIAAKIAAGEVVERPANAVKELVENSLDAGATEIRVEVREGGRRLLRVIDNGHGMTEEEAPLAFARHATSKLETVDDLERIATFGFRGEALYSIAAVSHITLTTRHRNEEFGVQLRLEGGNLLSQGRAGAPVGTSITIEHLFFNMPARAKFLRAAATEAGQIANVIQRYALAYPQARLSLINEGRLVFQSNGNGDLFDVLVKVYGLEEAKQMVKIGVAGGEGRVAGNEPSNSFVDTAQEESDVDFFGDPFHHDRTVDNSPPATRPSPPAPLSVHGYASLPTLTRANRTGITLFVNRRYVEDRSLVHAVIQSYHTLLQVGRYPVAVLMIDVDPSQVDVNVHPQKIQVRFVEERRIFNAVQKAVRRVIVDGASVPVVSVADLEVVSGEWRVASEQPGTGETIAQAELIQNPKSKIQNPIEGWAERRDAILNAGQQRAFDLYTPPNLPQGQPSSTPLADRADASDVPPELGGETRHPPLATRHSQLPPLRVVGQIGAMYIIAEGPDGIFLIDQHAAHERIMYEKFMAQRYGTVEGRVAKQHLLEPLTLHVGTQLTGLVAQYIEQLNHVGFEIEAFGGDTYLVRAVPSVLSGEDPQRSLEEIVSALADTSYGRRNLVGEEMEARLVKMVCKRASIKAGQLLSDIEMQELVRQLEECQSPRTCPHGRPTMIQLSAGELEKAFGRI